MLKRLSLILSVNKVFVKYFYMRRIIYFESMTKYRLFLSRESSELGKLYFKWQAYWGYTRHGGGLKATKELAKLCRIDTVSYTHLTLPTN